MAVCVWEEKTDVRLHMCMFSSHQGCFLVRCIVWEVLWGDTEKQQPKLEYVECLFWDVLFNRSAWFLHQNVPAVSVLWKLADFFKLFFFPRTEMNLQAWPIFDVSSHSYLQGDCFSPHWEDDFTDYGLLFDKDYVFRISYPNSRWPDCLDIS